MALTLYGGARSRASMPRWYMEEKSIPYQWQLLDMEAGEHRAEPFLQINPFGKVPALVDEHADLPGGRLQLFESGAILLYLAERYGGECGTAAERGLAMQWVLFANATLATALFVPSNREREFPKLMTVLDGRLAAGPLMDDRWSVADCAVNAYLAYLPIFFPQIDLSPYPHVQATIAATQQRPAYQTVMGQR
jgi:glutathione S-transferase